MPNHRGKATGHGIESLGMKVPTQFIVFERAFCRALLSPLLSYDIFSAEALTS